MGFGGIYVDRLGYTSDTAAAAVERRLAQLLDVRPLMSADGRLLFLDLS